MRNFQPCFTGRNTLFVKDSSFLKAVAFGT
jgi:hypothetical protein